MIKQLKFAATNDLGKSFLVEMSLVETDEGEQYRIEAKKGLNGLFIAYISPELQLKNQPYEEVVTVDTQEMVELEGLVRELCWYKRFPTDFKPQKTFMGVAKGEFMLDVLFEERKRMAHVCGNIATVPFVVVGLMLIFYSIGAVSDDFVTEFE